MLHILAIGANNYKGLGNLCGNSRCDLRAPGADARQFAETMEKRLGPTSEVPRKQPPAAMPACCIEILARAWLLLRAAYRRARPRNQPKQQKPDEGARELAAAAMWVGIILSLLLFQLVRSLLYLAKQCSVRQ